MSTPLLKKKHAEEPPIETGTSWMTKIGGVLGLPFSVFMGGVPLWIYLMAEKKEESGEFSFFIIGIIVLVILLFAAFGLLFLCASIQALVMRIRVDEEGVHVRLFTWRHYPWEKITPKNIMPLHTNRSRSNAFSPGDFTKDGIVRKPTGRDLMRTHMSRDSFLFDAIPIAVREKILQRIYAHFPPRTPLDLPDSLCFRTQDGLFKKRVILDTHGITIKTWMVEKRYTWTNVKRMVIHHISPFHSYYKGLHLDFNDGASLSLNELLPSRWLGPKPDPAVVMDSLARYVPQERRIEIIPGIPLTVKAMEWKLRHVLYETRAYIRIVFEIPAIALCSLGVVIVWLQHRDHIPWALLKVPIIGSCIMLVGFMAVFLAFWVHGKMYEIPKLERQIREAHEREQVNRNQTAR